MVRIPSTTKGQYSGSIVIPESPPDFNPTIENDQTKGIVEESKNKTQQFTTSESNKLVENKDNPLMQPTYQEVNEPKQPKLGTGDTQPQVEPPILESSFPVQPPVIEEPKPEPPKFVDNNNTPTINKEMKNSRYVQVREESLSTEGGIVLNITGQSPTININQASSSEPKEDKRLSRGITIDDIKNVTDKQELIGMIAKLENMMKVAEAKKILLEN